MKENEYLKEVIKEFLKITETDCKKAEEITKDYTMFFNFVEDNVHLKDAMYNFFFIMLQNYIIFRFYSEKSFAYFNVTEVLDKVPSYEAWMEKTKSLKVLAEAYCKEKQQNAQLKELLKECSSYIGRSATSRMIKNSVGFKEDMKLLTKIEDVLK